MLETIPKQYLGEVPSRLHANVTLFASKIPDFLGLSVGEIVRAHLSIMGYFGRLGQLFLRRLPSIREGQKFNVRRQAEILRQLIATSADNLQFFCLTGDVLGEIAGRDVGNALSGYAALFGRPISVHRELLGRNEFRVGPESHCLSPLDRFPLIAEEKREGWYAPNVRGFARSAPEVIHFTLNEMVRDAYESVRGALLEVYIRLMIESRAPELVVIQEKRWSSTKGGVDGPDLLIIDHSDDPAVIAVEVKYRRMVVGTRYELLDEHLVENYSDMWRALKKLPAKFCEII